jgi:hypothetical protein
MWTSSQGLWHYAPGIFCKLWFLPKFKNLMLITHDMILIVGYHVRFLAQMAKGYAWYPQDPGF